jgi:putative flippase GtrA
VIKSLPLVRQFSAFVVVGTISALCTLLIRALCNIVVPFEVAVILAQMAGMVIAFNLNRLFVFAKPAPAKPDFAKPDQIAFARFSRFALVNLLSLCIVTIVSSFSFRIALPALGINAHAALLAQVLGLGACTIPSFVGHKYFSFHHRQPQ